MTAIRERHRKADENLTPKAFFSYVLKLGDDDFYVGSTNSPLARFAEHALDVGAGATKGKSFKAVLVLPFLTRKEAEYNEERLKAALDKSPAVLQGLIDLNNQISLILRPEKTPADLRREETAYELEMKLSFHMWPQPDGYGGKTKPTACGWDGPIRRGPLGPWDATKTWERVLAAGA